MDRCLTVIYHAGGKWLPLGPPTARGSRAVKVPKNNAPVSSRRPIDVSFQGPSPIGASTWNINIGVPIVKVPSNPVPAARTGSVTAGPMVVFGTASDFTSGFSDGLSGQIGGGLPESLAPSDSGTYGGGGGSPGAPHLSY